MKTLMVEGGLPMWFLLLFGLLALAAAIRFAHRPERRFLRLAATLGLATAFTSLTGICAALGAVGHHAAAYQKEHPELSLSEVLLQGVAEAMSAGILGFTLLSLVALCIAVGFYRAGVRLDPQPA